MAFKIYLYQVLALTLFCNGLHAQKDIIIPFSDATGEKNLEIDIMNGRIVVKGSDRSDVLIKYKSESQKDDDHDYKSKSKGLKRISSGGFDLDIEEYNNVVSIMSDGWTNQLHLEIEVPKEINLDISKDMGEDISVENIVGDVNLETSIGSIYADGITGLVNASSATGEIIVSFDAIPKPKSMIFSTETGEIDITMPETYKSSFKMRTDWGDIFSDLDIEILERPEELKQSKDGGKLKIFSNNWTHANLNGGGPEIEMQTKMGDIFLRKKQS